MTSSGEVSPASITPSTTPLGAPKYGTIIPNRIFVGGIPPNTADQELKQFFSSFGAVKDTKIIADRAGVSKGYGFVTFETQEDADKIIKKEENLIFKDRKLNIGPAIRKQAFPRLYDPNISQSTLMFSNGVPYTYQNGMAFFHAPEGGYPVPAQTQVIPDQPSYPVAMVPHGQPVYVSQPYATAAYQTTTGGTPTATAAQWAAQAQWRWAPQGAAAPQYMYPTMQALGPDMYAAQPPHAAYQPELTEAGMVDAGPAAEIQEPLEKRRRTIKTISLS